MSKNVHTPKQRFALQMLVQAEFAASGTNDTRFAELAENKLGFGVSPSQVAGAREVFDIPSFATRIMNIDHDRFREIERRLAVVEQRIEVYLKGSR